MFCTSEENQWYQKGDLKVGTIRNNKHNNNDDGDDDNI